MRVTCGDKMIPFNCQTLLLNRASELMHWLKEISGGMIDIVIDKSVCDHNVLIEYVGVIKKVAKNTRVVSYSGEGGLRLRRNAFVIAIGGGTVIDDVKLRVYMDAFSMDLHLDSLRSGMVILPEIPHRAHVLAAIPTTLGTGSEASQMAIVRTSGRRRIAMGNGLAPTLAFQSSDFLQGLPQAFLKEGAIEILSRLIGPYIGDCTPTGVEDAVVRAYVSYITPSLINSSYLLETKWQNSLLRIGARAHQASVVYGRSYYGVKWWPIVNEICTITGERKVPVLASVLPEVFVRIMGGDERWGSARQLLSIWETIITAAPNYMSHDPVVGVQELFSQLVIRSDLTGIDAPDLAEQVVRAWGGGLPMLRGFSSIELENLLQSVIRRSAGSPLSEIQPTSSIGKEGKWTPSHC